MVMSPAWAQTCATGWACDRLQDGDTSVFPIDQTNPGPNDHVGMDLDGSDRIVAHHTKEDVGGTQDHRVRVRLPDVDPAVSVRLATGDYVDHPDVTVDSLGRYHVAWQRGRGTGSSVRHAVCDPATQSDCDANANWNTSELVDSGTDLGYPNVLTDGDRVFVAYMKNVATAGTPQFRVYVATRCTGDPWDSTEVLTPGDASRDQVLYWGRVAVAADRQDNVFHVVFVEGATWHVPQADPGDADLYWATTTYEDCP